MTPRGAGRAVTAGDVVEAPLDLGRRVRAPVGAGRRELTEIGPDELAFTSAEAAELLNTTFGVDALQEGLVIGVAEITINTSA